MSRALRREQRVDTVSAIFDSGQVEAALDLLELTELAWHDCYAELTPPDQVIDDILLISEGDLAKLARMARLAVTDWRDLRVAADERRLGRGAVSTEDAFSDSV